MKRGRNGARMSPHKANTNRLWTVLLCSKQANSGCPPLHILCCQITRPEGKQVHRRQSSTNSRATQS